jgi:hypothetical protein
MAMTVWMTGNYAEGICRLTPTQTVGGNEMGHPDRDCATPFPCTLISIDVNDQSPDFTRADMRDLYPTYFDRYGSFCKKLVVQFPPGDLSPLKC